jgi:hypothetical protein
MFGALRLAGICGEMAGFSGRGGKRRPELGDGRLRLENNRINNYNLLITRRLIIYTREEEHHG